MPINTAMALRFVKSEFLKIVRKRRSVNRCCTSISSTVSRRMFGSSEVRHSSRKLLKTVAKVLFFTCSS